MKTYTRTIKGIQLSHNEVIALQTMLNKADRLHDVPVTEQTDYNQWLEVTVSDINTNPKIRLAKNQ